MSEPASDVDIMSCDGEPMHVTGAILPAPLSGTVVPHKPYRQEDLAARLRQVTAAAGAVSMTRPG